MGIPVIAVPMTREIRPLTDLLGLLRLVQAIRRHRYAIVHSHSAKAGVLGRVAAWLTRTPVSLYAPRAFSYLSQRGLARRFFLFIERLLRPFTTTVVAASESERRRAIEEVGFEPGRVVAIPNAVDLNDAGAGPGGTPRTSSVVLTAGRLTYQKNPAMFVRVAALLVRRFPAAQFAIVGAGFNSPQEPDVRDLIRQLGLEQRIAILPWSSRSELLERIRNCTVFVLTSRFEGMPNVGLEAMMLGKPLVVTDVDGSRDLVENGVSGYVVPLDEDEEMARAVEAVLCDDALAARMGSAGRRRIQEFHDIRRTSAALASLYESLLRRRTTRLL